MKLIKTANLMGVSPDTLPVHTSSSSERTLSPSSSKVHTDSELSESPTKIDKKKRMAVGSSFLGKIKSLAAD